MKSTGSSFPSSSFRYQSTSSGLIITLNGSTLGDVVVSVIRFLPESVSSIVASRELAMLSTALALAHVNRKASPVVANTAAIGRSVERYRIKCLTNVIFNKEHASTQVLAAVLDRANSQNRLRLNPTAMHHVQWVAHMPFWWPPPWGRLPLVPALLRDVPPICCKGRWSRIASTRSLPSW